MTLSLRTRVLLGAILWTAGLVLLSFVVIAHVFKHFDLPVLGKSGSIHYIWGTHALFIVVTSVIAMVGGALQVRWGLAGIARLRTRLGAVHRGQEARVGGTYVSEVQPLVDDLNALLDQREEAVRRAVAKAGDLAHGLKTPLALLASGTGDRGGTSRHRRRRQRAGRNGCAARSTITSPTRAPPHRAAGARALVEVVQRDWCARCVVCTPTVR